MHSKYTALLLAVFILPGCNTLKNVAPHSNSNDFKNRKVDAAITDSATQTYPLIESGAYYSIPLAHTSGDKDNYGHNAVSYHGIVEIITKDLNDKYWEIGLQLFVRIREEKTFPHSDGTTHQNSGYITLLSGIPLAVSKTSLKWQHDFANNPDWKKSIADDLVSDSVSQNAKYSQGNWTYRNETQSGLQRLDQRWLFDGTPNIDPSPFGRVYLNSLSVTINVPTTDSLKSSPLRCE